MESACSPSCALVDRISASSCRRTRNLTLGLEPRTPSFARAGPPHVFGICIITSTGQFEHDNYRPLSRSIFVTHPAQYWQDLHIAFLRETWATGIRTRPDKLNHGHIMASHLLR
jgi:hypothetical protein